MSRLRLTVLTALTLVLLLTGLGPRASASPASSAPPSAPAGATPRTAAGATPHAVPIPKVQLHLQTVDPGIARPGHAVVFTGTVQNTSDRRLRAPVVRVRVSGRGLDTRARVAEWADGTDTGPTGDVVGRAAVHGLLLPGEQLPFTVRIPPKALHPSLSFGTLPTTLEVVPGMTVTRKPHKHASPRTTVLARPGATPLGSLRTFLPWDASSSYHRLRMSWVVPLTLPSNPALFGEPGPERTAAWEAAIGPGSRIDGLLTGTDDAPVTYVLDPVMVSPFVEPTTTAGTPSPSQSEPGSSPSSSPSSPPSSGPSTPGSTAPAGQAPTGAPTGSPTGGTDSTEGGGSTAVGGAGPTGPTSPTTGPSASGTETSPTPSGPTSPSSPTTTPPTPDPEQEIAALAADLAARLSHEDDTGTALGMSRLHQIWTLPADDPDLGAILPRIRRVNALPTLTGLMQTKVPPGLGGQVRAGVAWPVGTRLDHDMVAKLRRAYRTAPRPLSAALTPRGTVMDLDQPTSTAAHKSPSGLPLLAYDERLSAIAAATSDAADGGATVQRFLAETMAIYQQQPAVDRSVLVTPPRGFAGDPDVLQELFTQLRRAPWIQPTPAEQLLRKARHAEPMANPVQAPTQNPGGSVDIRSYPRPGATPLTRPRLRQVQHVMHELEGIAGITEGGQVDLVGRPAASDRQLLSTRWRAQPAAWATLAGQVRATTRDLRQSVHVVSSNVNFLADEGALQITVVNNLDADVRGVNLELFADNPNLQIAQQPGRLHIGAHSRTSVRVHVSALGSGDVPIHTLLTAPNGTRLGTQPSVIVHVQPTGSWIYGVVGIVAALILALGLYRTFRRGRGRQRDDENGTQQT